MVPAPEHKAGVGLNREWFLVKLVKLFVHVGSMLRGGLPYYPLCY